MENIRETARKISVDVMPLVRGADRGGVEMANVVAQALAAGIAIGRAEEKKKAEKEARKKEKEE